MYMGEWPVISIQAIDNRKRIKTNIKLLPTGAVYPTDKPTHISKIL